MFLLTFFKYIDAFGKEFYFNVDRGEKFKTPLGGFFSIIFYAMNLWILVEINRRDFRTSPVVLVNENYFLQSPLKNPMVNFAFQLVDNNGILIDDPRIIEYSYYHTTFGRNSTNIWVSQLLTYDVERCSPDAFGKENGLFALNTFYCKKKAINDTFGGDFSNKELEIPSAIIRRCSATTEAKYNIKCANNTEINSKKYFFVIYLQKKQVDIYNYTHPVREFYDYYVTELDLLSPKVKSVGVEYSKTTVSTDLGHVLSEFHDQSFSEFKHVYLEDFTSNELGPHIAKVYFTFGRSFKTISRVYSKLYDNTLRVFVIKMFLMNFLKNIYDLYLKKEFKHFLIQDLFHLQIEETIRKPRKSAKQNCN